ncbi:hypothetical protein [Paraburkholderia fungorum]|uniref:Uncharacterized protein n=1 Tax=Paraburkholderia fungorum TaxID=134537 RepID=A0AAW3V4C7_9BURK|nr:hypothetical protein [Paraburkholderia fungorum]MBB4517825.1 hypothetical protein [Paraburkholderia fungorum]MBB6205794.1 hypothetical protein [Paraburkholderia fungorum]
MIAVYEPLYREGQKLSEPAFLPLTITDNAQSAWREFRILVDFYRRGDHLRGTFSGIFSPKFRLKSLMDGYTFIAFVRDNDDADVCILNPYPSTAYLSFNVWAHGEAFHPGIGSRAQALLDASGVSWRIADIPRHNANNLCYSNFWVATPKFWEAYVGGILEPIARFLEANPHHSAARDVLEPTTHYTAAPFLPFIVERLFTTFLSLNPLFQVASHRAPYEKIMEYCLTDFEREIVREMAPLVDAADRSGNFSPELLRVQRLLSGLYQKYVIEHFAHNRHPHTGSRMPNA